VHLWHAKTVADVTALRLLFANRQQYCGRGLRRLAFTHPDTLDTVSMNPAELERVCPEARSIGSPLLLVEDPACCYILAMLRGSWQSDRPCAASWNGLDASVRIQLTHAVSLRDLGELATCAALTWAAPRVPDAGRAGGARDMAEAGWLLSTCRPVHFRMPHGGMSRVSPTTRGCGSSPPNSSTGTVGAELLASSTCVHPSGHARQGGHGPATRELKC
jgi:hypothetical protein